MNDRPSTTHGFIVAACVLIMALLFFAGCATPSVPSGGTSHVSEGELFTNRKAEGASSDAATETTASNQMLLSSSTETDNTPPTSSTPLPNRSSRLLRAEGRPSLYTYNDLLADITVLESDYPDLISSDTLGETVDGRDIIHLIVGNPDAENQILIHAGIHAREYATTQLVMVQAAEFLRHAVENDSYGATGYLSALQNNAIHVVPNANPDGWALCQQGVEALRDDTLRTQIQSIAEADGAQADTSYLRKWKANANGIDLNRNFDAMWHEYAGAAQPSSERYKGVAPCCEVESRALFDLTKRVMPTRTISYHTHGSVIYWYFGQDGTLFDDTLRFAQQISATTGYPLDADYESLDPAGYKDWALQTCGIPSITVEVGLNESPVPEEQYADIFAQNKHVWEEAIGM